MQLTQVNNSNLDSLSYSQGMVNSGVKDTSGDAKANGASLSAVTVEVQSNEVNLSSKLSAKISEISNLGVLQKGISKQLDLTNEIKSIVTSAQNDFELLNKVQPQVQSMMIDYNEISKETGDTLTANSKPKSRAFFDGVLGSKPLSTTEIFKAINKQQEMISQSQENLNNKANLAVQDSRNIIKQEKVVSQENSPFKDNDYSKDRVDLNIQTLGKMSDVQIDASNSTSMKLLS